MQDINEINIDDILKLEQLKLKSCNTWAGKFNIASNIIRLVGIRKHNSAEGYKYRLAKKIIIYNIRAIEENSYGYDYIDRENIEQCIANFNHEEKLNILIFYRRMLMRDGLVDDFDWINDRISAIKTSVYWNNRKYVRCVLTISAKNIYGMICFLLFVFCVTSLVLLESKHEMSAIFHFGKVEYFDNYYINHALNTLSLFFGIDDRQKFYPVTSFGVFLVLVYKFFIFVFMANFVIEEIKKRMKV